MDAFSFIVEVEILFSVYSVAALIAYFRRA